MHGGYERLSIYPRSPRRYAGQQHGKRLERGLRPPRRSPADPPLSDGSLSATFQAIADPTRRTILARLAQGEATVQELARPLPMSQPAVSKHLKVLERAGLIERRREAQRNWWRLQAKPLRDVALWATEFQQYWDEGFERLDELLKKEKDADR